jgi:GTPase
MSDEPIQESDAEFEAMLRAALGGTQHDNIDRAVDEEVIDEAAPEGHRSGYVAVVGQPNVGKSTLINQILGEKIAIVSPKPQTTRIRQLGILSRDDLQAVFIDTPGIHRPQDELGTFMMEVVKNALEDADVILFVVDISQAPDARDRQVTELLQRFGTPEKTLLVMNKVDAAKNPEKFVVNLEAYQTLLPGVEFITVSAKDGYKVPDLVEKILALLSEGPRYYPKDQVSDVPLRGIVAEMIREQVLRKTEQEVPHSIAVEVDEFKRRSDKLLYIRATIYVERDGQKGIIIGKKGQMLKTISTAARQDMETFVNSKVYLEIEVKVLPNWRQDEVALRRFGYRL